MHLSITGINPEVCFGFDSARKADHLAQAVFVNLNNFKRKTQ